MLLLHVRDLSLTDTYVGTKYRRLHIARQSIGIGVDIELRHRLSESVPRLEGLPSPRRRLSAAERRVRITDAGLEAFAMRGYDATSIGHIATAAGVTRTVLYDHFPDKRALFLDILETQNKLLVEAIASGITTAGEPRDRVRATVASYLRFTRDHPATRRLLLDPIPSGDAELDLVIRGHLRARSDAIGGLLSADLARTGMDPLSISLPVSVAVVSGAVDGVAQWWALNPQTTFDDVVAAATRLLWNGLPRAGVS